MFSEGMNRPQRSIVVEAVVVGCAYTVRIVSA